MSKYLYMMSSNASKEYMADILEVLSSPEGYAHHYRYQLKYIDPELRETLSHKGGPINESINNIRIVICFLYQVKKDVWEWDSVYPVRMGKLVEAYKTGDSDRDIAHFYFKVDNYIIYDNNDFNEMIKNALSRKYNKYYAAFGSAIDNRHVAGKNESKHAFYRTCESLNIEHFQLPSGYKYYPVFTFIEGLSIGNTVVDPKYDKCARTSYYEISEGSRYIFSFSTYFIEQPPQFSIELISNRDVFATPEKYELNIASRYDEESWSLASQFLNQNTWSNIKFQSNLGETEGKIPLNIAMTLPILVKRKMRIRMTEVASDIFYGSGIIVLAISRILLDWTWWYYGVGGLFFMWILAKTFGKFWRG